MLPVKPLFIHSIHTPNLSTVLKRFHPTLLLLMTLAPRSVAQLVPPPPQGTQTDAAFADSFKSNHVTNVFATTQKISCYTPEVPYAGNLVRPNGYTAGTPRHSGAKKGEDPRPYPTPNKLN